MSASISWILWIQVEIQSHEVSYSPSATVSDFLRDPGDKSSGLHRGAPSTSIDQDTESWRNSWHNRRQNGKLDQGMQEWKKLAGGKLGVTGDCY